MATGTPTAIPIIKPVFESLEPSSVVIETPFVATLDAPTLNAPTLDPDLRPEARAEEELDVLEAVPDVVVPVPATTTDPREKLSKVMRSTSVVSICINPKSQMINSSI